VLNLFRLFFTELSALRNQMSVLVDNSPAFEEALTGETACGLRHTAPTNQICDLRFFSMLVPGNQLSALSYFRGKETCPDVDGQDSRDAPARPA
jgi:hypothetical protein